MEVVLTDIEELLERKKVIMIRFKEYILHEPTVKEWLHLNNLDFKNMEFDEIFKEYILTLSNFDEKEINILTNIEKNIILEECFNMLTRTQKIDSKTENIDENEDKIYISLGYRIAKFCKYTSTSLNEAMNTNIFIFNHILDSIQAIEAEEALRMAEIFDNHLHLQTKNKEKYKETLNKYSKDFKEKGIKVVKNFDPSGLNKLKAMLGGAL